LLKQKAKKNKKLNIIKLCRLFNPLKRSAVKTTENTCPQIQEYNSINDENVPKNNGILKPFLETKKSFSDTFKTTPKILKLLLNPLKRDAIKTTKPVCQQNEGYNYIKTQDVNKINGVLKPLLEV
jgi:hypothetical protein